MVFPKLKHNLSRYLLMGLGLLATCSLAAAQTAKSNTYKITEAGVQIDLPAGWDASKDPNGTHTIVKKDGDSYVVYSMSVVPREPAMTVDMTFAAFSEGIFEHAKKEWKGFKAGDIVKDTVNGMDIRAQKIEGTDESLGGELEGLVVVIDSSKPLGIFGQRTKKHSDTLENEGSQILGSIKKIQ